jgi:hypothetical protein
MDYNEYSLEELQALHLAKEAEVNVIRQELNELAAEVENHTRLERMSNKLASMSKDDIQFLKEKLLNKPPTQSMSAPGITSAEYIGTPGQ